jgi:hypothetical protein
MAEDEFRSASGLHVLPGTHMPSLGSHLNNGFETHSPRQIHVQYCTVRETDYELCNHLRVSIVYRCIIWNTD